MFVLGVSWLVLTPLCLWNLFRGGRLVRLTSVLALVALEAATIWATTAARVPPRTPVLAAPSVVAPGQAPPPTGLSGPLPEASRQDARSASCAAGTPVPALVRPARRRDAARGMTLLWTARGDGCATASVVLRHRNRVVR
ncbi:hypothetical protein ACLQ2R_18220 [Streptosporangium sp. DT93]|uniref:hypothetical protein n=1 Tax=Streptosporangium sp. DT93 TaxID=3393428 RepID=UPI003CEA53F6